MNIHPSCYKRGKMLSFDILYETIHFLHKQYYAMFCGHSMHYNIFDLQLFFKISIFLITLPEYAVTDVGESLHHFSSCKVMYKN